MELNKIYNEDCIETLRRMEDKSINVILTSPPYNKSRQQSYSEQSLATMQGHYKDFNDARSNEEYIAWTLERFAEFARVLADDGVVCYNMSYGSDEIRTTELMWLVVSSILQQGKFTMGDCIVWRKKTATPNNVSPNKMTRICEFVFIFCKRESYDSFHCNKEVVGENSRTGQRIYENYYNLIEAENNDGTCEIHKATYSTSLCFQLLDRYGVSGGMRGVVYDPFMGTGTTAIAAIEQKMDFIGSEISAEYCEYANQRIHLKESEPSLF